MNKEEFVWILQSALLHYNGVNYEELMKLGARSKLAKTGIKLCNYLNKEVKTEVEFTQKPTVEVEKIPKQLQDNRLEDKEKELNKEDKSYSVHGE